MAKAPRDRPFSVTEADIEALRASLGEAGFDEAGVSGILGVPSVAALRDLPAELALERSGGDTTLAALVRLFVIGVPVSEQAAGRALGKGALRRLEVGGILGKSRGGFLGSVKLSPIDGLVLAFDRTFEGETEEAADFVMGPSDSARRLSKLTVERQVDDALDLGTGCGYLALLAARHAKRVVATDINERAKAFTELNAALNGVRNVEAVAGDLFAPVARRRFDLVVSNPPFVIAPSSSLVYLHGGMESDAFCRRIVSEAPAVLRPGGLLQMLFAWAELDEGEWHERLEAWFEGTGCDAWVLRSSSTERSEYARGWMNVGRVTTAKDESARFAEWMRYFEKAKIASVGGGLLTMRKREGRTWFRAFDAPAQLVGSCGAQIEARLDALSALDGLEGDPDLLKAVFALSDDTRLLIECAPSPEGWAQQAARVRVMNGLAYDEDIDSWVAELLAACNGKRTLREAVDAAAAKLDLGADEVPDETPDLVRQLVEEGFLVPKTA